MMNEIPNESRVFQVKCRCVLAAVALLFSFFFFVERAKKNEREKNEQKKEDFLMHELKGGSSRHIIYSYHRSTGVTHTHSIPRNCAQNKESEREREKRRGAKHFFFYRR